MTARYNHTISVRDSEAELARLTAEVYRAAHQTGQVSQAVTRVAAEVRCLADEVDALAAEYGQGPVLGTPHGR